MTTEVQEPTYSDERAYVSIDIGNYDIDRSWSVVLCVLPYRDPLPAKSIPNASFDRRRRNEKQPECARTIHDAIVVG